MLLPTGTWVTSIMRSDSLQQFSIQLCQDSISNISILIILSNDFSECIKAQISSWPNIFHGGEKKSVPLTLFSSFRFNLHSSRYYFNIHSLHKLIKLIALTLVQSICKSISLYKSTMISHRQSFGSGHVLFIYLYKGHQQNIHITWKNTQVR